MSFIDDGTHFVVQVAEPLTVEQLSFDWAVTLNLLSAGEPFTVRLESEFFIATRDDTPLMVSPPAQAEQAAGSIAVLGLWRRTVTEVRASHAGELLLAFTDGRTLIAPSNPDHEAWTLNGPHGLRLVSGPGGELAAWPPEDG